MSEERWVPIDGHEHRFEVSDQGRIRSIGRYVEMRHWRGGTRKRWVKPTFIKLWFHHDWLAARVNVSAESRDVVSIGVARAVWTAFKGKIPVGCAISQRNEDARDCRLENLFMGPMDYFRNINVAAGACKPGVKLTADKVRAIRAATGSQASIGRAHGVSQSMVCAIRNGKAWKTVA